MRKYRYYQQDERLPHSNFSLYADHLVFGYADRVRGDEPQSFRNLQRWIANVSRLAGPSICRIVVGNKVDIESRREVRRDEGKALANSLGLPFLETTGKTSFNMRKLFRQMCLATLQAGHSPIPA
jgi:GTPase SAR1 family protein